MKLLSYLFRFVTLGLALAFLAVVIRPELLSGRMAHAPRDGTPSSASGDGAPRSYADAVARTSAAVVNIYTQRLVSERTLPQQFGGGLFGENWPNFRQRVERSLGSGVIIDKLGHVVTNNHVISDAASIVVQIADGRSVRAKVVGRDPETDIALLKIELDQVPVMPLGRSDTLRV